MISLTGNIEETDGNREIDLVMVSDQMKLCADIADKSRRREHLR